MAQKELARRDFLEFIRYMSPGYRAEWYHEHIARRLEAWARHEIPWLIITLPPRHGKSELVSRYLPAWILGAIRPDANMLASSGDQALTNDNSTDVRRIIDDDRYRELFPDTLLEGRVREDIWETSTGGVYRAKSTGSGLSGRGANFFFIDDYFSNQADADSQAERDRLWQWWNSDAKKRLEWPASVVVMATRWHHDDLIGRILQSPEAERFEVIHIPKVNDWLPHEQPSWDPRAPGEPILGPFSRAPNEFFAGEHIPPSMPNARIVERSDIAERVLTDYRLDMATNARTVSALDQGRPTPRGGALFKREWLRYYDVSSQEAYDSADEVVISVDAASKTGRRNDPSALLVAARVGPKIFLLDMVVRRMEFPELLLTAQDLQRRWPKAKLLIEDTSSGAPLIQQLRRKLNRVVAFSPSKYGSKETRAQYAADAYAGSSVLHPRTAPWLEAFELELSQFPGGRHDDQVDAVSQLCIHWGERHGQGRARLQNILRNFSW